MTPAQEKALKHLGYEWWMLRATCDLLERIPLDVDPVRNALIESLVVHVRGLIYFFHFDKSFPTDINATDLGVAITPEPPELTPWREDANKRVAHITSLRFDVVKEWQPRAAQAVLEKRIDVVRAQFPSLSDWTGDASTASRLLPPARLLQPSSGGVSTGVAASIALQPVQVTVTTAMLGPTVEKKP